MFFLSQVHQAATELIERLLARDEAAFKELVDTYHSALMRLAMVFVAERATAEEVVQETWLAVLKGLHRFEGRSSLKTWIFRILTYQAQKRATRDARVISLTDFAADEPAIDPSLFRDKGHWATPPTSWGKDPEDRLMRADVLEAIEGFIEKLPPSQRAVLTLRDVEGWDSQEVCDLLEISQGNQRILLHRARVRMRDMITAYLEEGGP